MKVINFFLLFILGILIDISSWLFLTKTALDDNMIPFLQYFIFIIAGILIGIFNKNIKYTIMFSIALSLFSFLHALLPYFIDSVHYPYYLVGIGYIFICTATSFITLSLKKIIKNKKQDRD